MEKYPLSTKLMKAWYKKLMIENLKNSSVSEKEIEELVAMGVINDDLSGILSANPIALCRFFDEEDIYIETTLNMNKTFSVKILAGGGMLVDTREYDRHGAEVEAVTMAIKLLEEQLKPKQDAGPDSQSSDTQVSE